MGLLPGMPVGPKGSLINPRRLLSSPIHWPLLPSFLPPFFLFEKMKKRRFKTKKKKKTEREREKEKKLNNIDERAYLLEASHDSAWTQSF
jgi:hypothetical protein